MHRVFTCASYLVGVMFLSACSTIETPQQAQRPVMAEAQDPTRVQFTQPLHFLAPDGSDVVVPAGTYRVEQATGSQIRLVPSGDGLPTLLSAEAMPTDLVMAAPIALALPSKPDVYDLVLLVPGGPALETRGSVSGVLPRGGSSLLKAIITMPPLESRVPPQQPSPDLWPSRLRLSCSGPEFSNVFYVVSNIGNAPAGPSHIQLQMKYLSHTVGFPGLAPGQNLAVSSHDDCRPYVTQYETVTCPVTLRVDVLNEVAENNELNNSLTKVCGSDVVQ